MNAFCALAFRNDQETHAPPFEQQWFHREWQRVWGAERFSVTLKATGFGGTDQMIGRCIWELGRNPNLRISLISKTVGKAEERLAKIKRNIEENPVVREVFPDLLPGDPWNTETLRVKGACLDTTTNSVSCFGIGSDLLGTRIDLGFLDDVNDDENTRSGERREADVAWADKSVLTRLTSRGRLHVIANAFHPQDLAHSWRKRRGFHAGEYPAETPDGGLLWPSFRSREWLADIRAKMTPTTYAQMFLCQARDDATRVFQKHWFEAARRRGAGLMPVRELPRYTDEPQAHELFSGAMYARRSAMRAVIGWDLATGKKEKRRKSDTTCPFTLGLHPDGSRQVLWVEVDRWPAAVTLTKIDEHEQRYHPERHEVEDNGGQTFLVQFTQHFASSRPRLEGFTTSGEKWDEALGIEGIGVEMQAGKWIIPGPAEGESEEAYLARLGSPRRAGESDATYAARHAAENPEYRRAYAAICAWAEKLLDFSRVGHTPDEVMASYLAKEAATRMALGVFRPLSLHGDPHPASPGAEAERERHAMGNASLYQPAPAPAPMLPPLPFGLPSGLRLPPA